MHVCIAAAQLQARKEETEAQRSRFLADRAAFAELQAAATAAAEGAQRRVQEDERRVTSAKAALQREAGMCCVCICTLCLFTVYACINGVLS
jgi:hypothetical protein